MLAGLVNWWSQENMKKENQGLVDRVIELEDEVDSLLKQLDAAKARSYNRFCLYEGKAKGKSSFVSRPFRLCLTEKIDDQTGRKENFYEVIDDEDVVMCSSYNLSLVWKYVVKAENDARQSKYSER